MATTEASPPPEAAEKTEVLLVEVTPSMVLRRGDVVMIRGESETPFAGALVRLVKFKGEEALVELLGHACEPLGQRVHVTALEVLPLPEAVAEQVAARMAEAAEKQ